MAVVPQRIPEGIQPRLRHAGHPLRLVQRRIVLLRQDAGRPGRAEGEGPAAGIPGRADRRSGTLRHDARAHYEERRVIAVHHPRPGGRVLPQEDLSLRQVHLRRGFPAEPALPAVVQDPGAHGLRLGEGLRARAVRARQPGGGHHVHPFRPRRVPRGRAQSGRREDPRDHRGEGGQHGQHGGDREDRRHRRRHLPGTVQLPYQGLCLQLGQGAEL